MLRVVRKHINPTTVIATLALLFAMSGGAYAASRYLITSTKQISPKVLKSLKGANGKNGANGANGASGAQGPTGPAGPAGSTGPAGSGSPGATGKEGPQGPQGPKGENGTTGFTATLPSGKTETGSWVIAANEEEATNEEIVRVPLSFAIPLESEEFRTESPVLDENHVHFFAQGEVATAGGGCGAGSAAKPEAEPGNLCVYTGLGGENAVKLSSSSGSFRDPSLSSAETGAGATGAVLQIQVPQGSVSGGTERFWGTWAVSAP